LEITLGTTEIILAITVFLLVVVLISKTKLELKIGDKGTYKDLSELSAAEYKVMDLLSQGKSNKSIAEELFISVATVKKHVTNIFKKLEISKRTEARNYKKYFEAETQQNT